MKMDLEKLLDFVKFTHEIRNVQRAVLFESEDRHENDAEHGYQMALVAWFLIEIHNLKLDVLRCVGMAMVHDITEVYAGDVSIFASKKERKIQIAKEREAAKQFMKDWSTFTSLHELIDEYVKHETPEGKFVYALDKLMPEINNYLYEGRAWKAQKVTLEKVKEIKKGKIEVDATINNYHQKLLGLMKDSDIFWHPDSVKE